MLCFVITGFIQTLHKIASRILINHLYYLSFCRCVARRFHPFSLYQKALIANAASSALRLHQRLPRVQLSRDYFSRLLLEDSAHYLLYSVMFLYSTPMTGARIDCRSTSCGAVWLRTSTLCSARARVLRMYGARARVLRMCVVRTTCVAYVCCAYVVWCACVYSAAHRPVRNRSCTAN